MLADTAHHQQQQQQQQQCVFHRSNWLLLLLHVHSHHCMSIPITACPFPSLQVPADVRVICTKGTVMVDNAALTGESMPQKRSTETTDNNPLETKNLCFFGTSIVMGSCYGIVVATGDHTVMGRIAALAAGTTNEDSPIAKEIHHFVLIVSTVARGTL